MGFQIEMGALEGWAGGSGKDSGSYIAVKTHPFPFHILSIVLVCTPNI